MVHLNTRREGFALVGAIAALVLIGVLVTGGFVAATQEGAISESTRYASEAFNAAEYGLSEIVGTWRIPDYRHAAANSPVERDLCRNGTAAVVGGCPNNATIGRYSVVVSPIGASGDLFLVRSTGEIPRHGRLNRPERTLARVVRMSNFNIPMDRAVTSGGPLHLKGTAEISGRDSIPNTFYGRDQCENVGEKTGVVARNAASVTTQGSAKLKGAPAKKEDPTINEHTFSELGDLTYDQLAAMATFTVPNHWDQNTAPELTMDSRCDERVNTNWGSPTLPNHQCRNFFPIIHATGDLHMNGGGKNGGGTGQGILLVDGNLQLNGGYEFYGIVIVKGTLQGGSGGARIFGGTFVQGGADLDNTSGLEGNPVVNLSSCAITRALENNPVTSYAFPISSRSWFDLSAAGAGS